MTRKPPYRCRTCDKLLMKTVNWSDFSVTHHLYICKTCKTIQNREYRAAHRERLNAVARAYQQANPDKEHARTTKWREKNAQHYRDYQKQYSKENRARLSAYQAEYRRKRREENDGKDD